MNRVQLFTYALEQLSAFRREFPELDVCKSIQLQLEFLRDFDPNDVPQRLRLNDIIIGVLAAREIEPRDSEFAETLYEVAEAVESMKSEY